MKPGPPAAFGKYENIIIYEDFPGVLGSTEPRKKAGYMEQGNMHETVRGEKNAENWPEDKQRLKKRRKRYLFRDILQHVVNVVVVFFKFCLPGFSMAVEQ